jgi:hypothetical protein
MKTNYHGNRKYFYKIDVFCTETKMREIAEFIGEKNMPEKKDCGWSMW